MTRNKTYIYAKEKKKNSPRRRPKVIHLGPALKAQLPAVRRIKSPLLGHLVRLLQLLQLVCTHAHDDTPNVIKAA